VRTIKTLLLVEDHLGDARLLREMLNELGSQIDVVHVESMRETESYLSEHAVDLILLDLGLPDVQGLEAVQRARAIAPRVPLVVLTGLDDETLAAQTLQEGAQDYLIKGQIDARALGRGLHYAVGRAILEDAVFVERERAQVTLNCIGDAVASTDMRGDISFLNLTGERLTGWLCRDAVGRPMGDVVQIVEETTRHPFPSPLEARVPGRVSMSSNWVLIRRDHSEIPIEASVASIRDRGGRAIGAVIVFRDVSEQRAVETRLRQVQKMEAVGQLAGGVAHDFNNLLTAILGFAQLVLDDLPAGSPTCDDVREIQGAGERAAALTAQLLAFSRNTLLRPRVIDLNVLIRNTQFLLRPLLGDDVILTSDLAADLSAVCADAGQVDQMIVNVAVNARDAMPSGGQLSIKTSNAMLDDAFVADHPGSTVGPHVMMAFTDTGTGMDEDVRRQIFEPFYSTKGPGKGTGLGLAMVFGIMKQTGGSIWVDSQPGVGSTFSMYFPATDEPLAEERRPDAPVGSVGSETILVVDDQDAVRRLVLEVLGRSGYTVIVASDPHEALRLLANRPMPISLLLTDMVMPLMSGPELARICQAKYPELRVLYMSGYANDTVRPPDHLESGFAIIQKPFAVPVLLQRIRGMLDAPGSPAHSAVSAIIKRPQ